MPAAKRRRTTAASSAAAKQQQTLSFRSTKANAQDESAELPGKTGLKSKSTAKASTAKAQPVDIEHPTGEEHDSTLAEQESAQSGSASKEVPAEPEDPIEEEEDEEDEDAKIKAAEEAQLNKRALAVSDSKIKTYWSKKEQERKAPRVHQEGLSVREKILREFDMTSRYGPSIGISRIARWRRAHGLGMEPPMEVLSVLLKEEQSKGGKDDTNSEKSIMDELILSSRLIEA